MNLIEWSDDFSVGVSSVDFEHQQLITLINTLYASFVDNPDKYTVLDFVGEIYTKIASHFALEEKKMREHNYAGYQEHKQDHERLLDELLNMMDECEAASQVNNGELAKFLNQWFGEHFRTMDARLHRKLG